MKTLRSNLVFLLLMGILGGFLFSCSNKKSSQEDPDKLNLVLIQYNDSPLSELSHEGILKGMEQMGYTVGKDFTLKEKNAQGDIATLNLIVDGVWNDRPDLIFVTSTPTLQVVAKKIKNIPVVFTVVADPVAAGAGSSFTEHQANLTGISTLGDYEGMIKWLKNILPDVKKIGTLFSPGEVNSVNNMNDLKKYAQAAGIDLITVPVNATSEIIDATLALAGNKPEVICQIIDNLTSAAFSGIAKTASEQNIPIFGFVSDQADKGAVLVISRNYIQAGIDAARLADKIFKGSDPATIPFEFVSKTDVLINSKAAEKYGITLSKEWLDHPGVIQVDSAKEAD
jgi:ABC-type uncharacterized transport system substrate-binding protein